MHISEFPTSGSKFIVHRDSIIVYLGAEGREGEEVAGLNIRELELSRPDCMLTFSLKDGAH